MKKILFVFLSFVVPCLAATTTRPTPFAKEAPKNGFTINYQNVALAEYVRFVSKVTGVNFLFTEEELAIPVTIVSEEPITPENVMATLTQILRIQGFLLLQEDNNLVIHKNPDVKQPARLVFNAEDMDRRYPLTTRVFRLKNESAEALAAVIRPMMSKEAQIETLPQTNLLIVTDITENIETIAELLSHIDTTNSSAGIELYRVKHNDPAFLAATTKEILAPIAAGKPLLITNPPGSSNLFIVANPRLTERALSILRNLDKENVGKHKIDPNNVFMYKVRHRSAKELLHSLQQIAKNIEKNGYKNQGIVRVLQTAHSIDQGKSILFTASGPTLVKVQELMQLLDTPEEKKSLQGQTVFLYHVKNRPIKEVLSSMREIASSMMKEGYEEKGLIQAIQGAKAIEESHSILFTGVPSAIEKIRQIIPGLDVPTKKALLSEKNSFFLYKPLHASPEKIYQSLQEIFHHLEKNPSGQKDLIDLQKRSGITKTAGALVFTGDAALFPKIKEMLSLIDVARPAGKESQFLAYQPQHLSGEKIVQAMKEYGKQLKASGFSDPNVLESIKDMKWIASTGSILFTGTPPVLQKIDGLLQTIDTPNSAFATHQTFFLHHLQYISKERFEEYFKQLQSNLAKENAVEKPLLQAISSMKWIQQSHSFLFTGPKPDLAKLQKMAEEIDNPTAYKDKPTFVLIQVKNVSRKMVEKYLDQIASNLDQEDQKQERLYQAIRSMKWIDNSASFMFSGEEPALKTIQSLIASYDMPSAQVGESYFVYKLKHKKGDVIEKALESFAQNMRKAAARNAQALEVIDNLKWIKATNSLVLIGPPTGIEEVKKLIAEFDVAHPKTAKDEASDFFMYKPQHMSPEMLQTALLDVAKSLKEGGLIDSGLIQAIQSMQYSEKTRSLVFTGAPSSLQKIGAIIKELDIPGSKDAAIQRIGKTSFLVYKLKNASSSRVIQAIDGVIQDLKKSKNYDKQLVKTLQSMKHVKDTNSLVFTGPESALEKAKTLVMKFDVSGLGEETPPSKFFIYKPEFKTGPELEKLLKSFADHLKDSGLSDPGLYASLFSAKYIPATKSLVFTGSEESLGKTKQLIGTIDVPSGERAGQTSEIQPIDNTSFLVYKLQYHKGSDLQAALQSIGKDLAKSNSKVNASLLDAIRSIQWLEITNSLLVTGDQQTLTRLKELIKNLDVPLKQVFIEVLAIQTTLNNMLDFGLDWGSKGDYRGSFGYSTGNFGAGGTDGTFGKELSAVNPSNSPNPANIPFISPGFDLGVIGNVITHKGRSFFTLGSLLRALQQDEETAILLTPKIIAQDNKTSSLFVGRNIPYTGSVLQNLNSSTSAGIFQTSNIEYRDIGLNLTITPVIGNSDVISLAINIENSVDPTDAAGETLNTNTQTGRLSGITTTKTTLDTTVHVPNESFLVLSGLVDVLKRRQTSAVPCLGGIPFIGSAFSSMSRSDTINNIVFFIRPRILHSREDMRVITEEQEDVFREGTGSTLLEKEFDEGMESIKSIDDE